VAVSLHLNAYTRVRVSNMEKKLEQIESTLHSIDKTLALNTQQLAEHMRRTSLLEKEITPIARHVQQMQGAGKLLAVLALIATILMLLPLLK
jgi:hypothetical protein